MEPGSEIIHANVSRETEKRLLLYMELLLKWQKTINLVSQSTLQDGWNRHIIDSLQLFPYLPKDAKLADLGSGAGLPGLILAIAGHADVTLIESDKRKCSFLREAARQTETTVKILADRIENTVLDTFDVITARGFAPLPRMLEMLENRLKTTCRLLILKGDHHTEEIANARRDWDFTCAILPSKTQAGSAILDIGNLTKRTE